MRKVSCSLRAGAAPVFVSFVVIAVFLVAIAVGVLLRFGLGLRLRLVSTVPQSEDR